MKGSHGLLASFGSHGCQTGRVAREWGPSSRESPINFQDRRGSDINGAKLGSFMRINLLSIAP
jgi:hypothetical protein